MAGQKYYVKLIQTGLESAEERYQLYLWKYFGKYSYHSKVYEEEHQPTRLSNFQFTKSELVAIMDGALYKFHAATAEWNELEHPDWKYNPYIDQYEWKNPLIELVPTITEFPIE
jgi:hypothetical protein